MSETKFTPGPWWTTRHGEWIAGRDPDVGEIIVAKTEGLNWEANACLIAAIPDIYDAAQAVVERWDSPLWKNLPHTKEYIDELRAALAKARGEA